MLNFKSFWNSILMLYSFRICRELIKYTKCITPKYEIFLTMLSLKCMQIQKMISIKLLMFYCMKDIFQNWKSNEWVHNVTFDRRFHLSKVPETHARSSINKLLKKFWNSTFAHFFLNSDKKNACSWRKITLMESWYNFLKIWNNDSH